MIKKLAKEYEVLQLIVCIWLISVLFILAR